MKNGHHRKYRRCCICNVNPRADFHQDGLGRAFCGRCWGLLTLIVDPARLRPGLPRPPR